MIRYDCDRCKQAINPPTMTTLEISFGDVRHIDTPEDRTAHLCIVCRGTLIALLNGEPL